MVALLDANVILNYLTGREGPYRDACREVIVSCATGNCTVAVVGISHKDSIITFTNVYSIRTIQVAVDIVISAAGIKIATFPIIFIFFIIITIICIDSKEIII